MSGFSRQWRRCDKNGNNCANISGATGSTYLLGPVDLGARIRVVVTAANSAGQTAATSTATDVVVAPPPPPPSGTVEAGVGSRTMVSSSGAASVAVTATGPAGSWPPVPSRSRPRPPGSRVAGDRVVSRSPPRSSVFPPGTPGRSVQGSAQAGSVSFSVYAT